MALPFGHQALELEGSLARFWSSGSSEVRQDRNDILRFAGSFFALAEGDKLGKRLAHFMEPKGQGIAVLVQL